MKSQDEEKITRWIDGELGDADVAEILEQHPELREMKLAAQKNADLLRRELDHGEGIPYPDFFNHQIRKRIDDGDAEQGETAALEDKPVSGLFPWFHLTRNLAGAAFLVLLGIFIGKAFSGAGGDGSSMANTYAPDPTVEAEMYYSNDAQATVLVLEGLAAIPDDTEITGHKVASYSPGPGGAVPPLVSLSQPGKAIMLVTGAGNVPSTYEIDYLSGSRNRL